MTFFDDLPPDEPEEEPEPRYRTPAWIGPADDVIPATVPLEVVLARTDDVLVWLGGVVAYDEGFAFDVRTVTRRRRDAPRDPFDMHGFRRDPQALRFGVQFADGRKAADEMFARGPGGLVLTSMGGGGGGANWQQGYWVHPLPPPGPLTFVCAWPAFGIDEARTEVDAELVLEASRRAFVVWPDDRPPLPPDEDDEDGPAMQWIR